MIKKLKFSLGVLGLVLLLANFVLADNFLGSSKGLGASQYYQPSFNTYYSSSQLDTYWPILNDMKNGQCQASNDFLVAIPPLGCTPSVVRSDLLEEQNVPIFCQLDALQVNPLIKVSSIESITFKGDYPAEVAGISFHPARAAANTRENLLGSPLLNNIGYVVIILKRTSAEKDMPEFVKGNLTATIKYDAEEAFGVGRAEFLLPVISDENWSREFRSYSFWNGRGYARLLATEGETAQIGLYTDEDTLLKKITLKKGETSREVYFPGFYCKAGLEVRLNNIDSAVDKVRLSVGGDEVWASKNTKILNGKCTVTNIIPSADGTGLVSISCPGQKFDLTLSSRSAMFDGKEVKVGELVKFADNVKNDTYLIYAGNLPEKVNSTEREFAVLYKSEKAPDSVYLARVVKEISTLSNSATILPLKEFEKLLAGRLGKDSVSVVLKSSSGFQGINSEFVDEELTDPVKTNFTAARAALDKLFGAGYSNEKDTFGDEWGKKALDEYATAAESLGQTIEQKWALEMLVEKYPSSIEARNAKDKLSVLENLDISKAGQGVYVNNKYSYILVKEFKLVALEDKNVVLNIASKQLTEGDEVCLESKEEAKFLSNTSDNTKVRTCSKVSVKKIYTDKVDLSFYVKNEDGTSTTKPVTLYLDGVSDKTSYSAAGINVYLSTINVKEEASISILPKVDNTRTEANFTFNVGIEKRSIELSPAKTKQMINNLNRSISDWEDRVEKLGNLVTAWKGACFATSAFMVMSNFVSGLDGESIARREVMEKYKIICEEKIGSKEFDTLSKCYNDPEIKKNIESAVSSGTSYINSFNTQIKGLENQSLMSDGKTINQTRLKENMVTQYRGQVPNAEHMTTEQIKDYLFWKNQKDSSSDPKLILQAENNLATLNKTAKDYEALQKNSEGGVISRNSATDIVALRREGSEIIVAKTDLRNKVGDGDLVQVIEGIDSKKYYVIAQKESENSERYVASQIYSADNLNEDLAKKALATSQTSTAQTRAVEDIQKIRFVESSCNNEYKNPLVKYYTVGVDKALPSLVPFDKDKGWYVKMNQGGGGILSSNTNAYTSSGIPQTYTVCNVGANKLEENGLGDDICQTFSQNYELEEFGGCYGMSTSEIKTLKSKAQRAIQEASNQYGQTDVRIAGQNFGSMLTSASDSGLDCYSFMSISQCNTLFNVCDPVICPTSRCNLGGKYPVSNVIQSGIIGSLVLCLPNFPEVKVPVCLTGIHAGLESYLSILESERDCLQENLDSGKMVGICDEITSVYKCEFFWNQVAPIASQLVPTMFEMASGQKASRGGAEYMSVRSSWENMQSSIDYFKNSYAQNSFNAFKFKNIQEVGSEFCRASIGTSVPGGADLVDGLLAPESPTQFYANFDESVFTEATVPPTSQYKVYYHIFAGNDQGVRYSVYLKSPPDSPYYNSNPIVNVKTSYITRGETADEAIDFTAPAGYKELCVMINAQEECGFKTVTTSMAVNYLTDKYVADQREQTDINSEKDCISGKASVLGLITSSNLQAGAENAVNPDVSLRGIVRVCATDNPGKGTNPDRWEPVGNCGNEKIGCWLDKDSVNETMTRVQAVEGTLADSSETAENLAEKTRITNKEAAEKISSLEKSIKDWNRGQDILKVVDGLNEVIEGTAGNQYKANALFLKGHFHLKVIDSIETIKLKELVVIDRQKVDETVHDETPDESKEETPQTNKPNYVLADPKLTINGKVIGEEIPKDSTLDVDINKQDCDYLDFNLVTDRKWDLIFNKKQTIKGQSIDLSSIATINDKVGKTSWISVKCMVNNKVTGKEVRSVEFKIVDEKTMTKSTSQNSDVQTIED